MIVFAVEPLEQCWSAIYDKPDGLAYLHWLETKSHQYDQQYGPSFERYDSYAQAGWFRQFTVRDNGKLVGFSGVYITPSMHTQAMLAVEDTWYLLPEYRKGWNAIKFYRYIEEQCIGFGAEESTLTVPDSKERGIHILLLRLGYKTTSMQYSKKLTPATEYDSVPTVTHHCADSATVPNVAAVKEGANESTKAA